MSDRRATTDARRKAADDLIVDVSNLRDQATARKRGMRGDYELWPLRTRLYITQNAMRDLPAYSAAWEFYSSAKDAREFARNAVRRQGADASAWNTDERGRLRVHLANLDRYGDEVIGLLQENPHQRKATVPIRPTIPTL